MRIKYNMYIDESLAAKHAACQEEWLIKGSEKRHIFKKKKF